ncbi:unnamed protein product [Nippostrongylus brasiliensis]|uniref:RabBD domain-containing protein n=1 Tax=Nippostrongylus brasiliensis TaxID=27835 RepID=A0A0N4YA06_NIPBR|nr:unnamed protein product [Nippostrongylus brasiliensis]
MMSIEDAEQLYELLRGLSPREQAIIRPVLERDLEFQRREKARVRQLRSYVEMSEMQQHIGQVVRKTPGYPLMQSMSSDNQHSHRLDAFATTVMFGSAFCSMPEPDAPNVVDCSAAPVDEAPIAPNGSVRPAIPSVSEVLLSQMRRAAAEKEKQEEQKNSIVHVTVRAPMLSRRQLTLPTITTPSLLAVPSESDMKTMDRKGEPDRFWGGSPSPRTPRKSVDLLDSVNVIGPTPPPSATPHGLHPSDTDGTVISRGFTNSSSSLACLVTDVRS